jgi:hypothetical protein
VTNTVRIMQWSKGALGWRDIARLPASVYDRILEMAIEDAPATDFDE